MPDNNFNTIILDNLIDSLQSSYAATLSMLTTNPIANPVAAAQLAIMLQKINNLISLRESIQRGYTDSLVNLPKMLEILNSEADKTTDTVSGGLKDQLNNKNKR
jgi:ribosomal protein L16 Arg81 hydroxylase